MTKHTISRSCSAAVLGLALVAGCQSDPYKEAAKANSSMGDAKTELISDKNLLTQTVDDLNVLVYHPATDLTPQYQKYAKDVDQLDKSVAASMRTNKGMTENRQAYLAEWRAKASANPDADLRMRAFEQLKTREASFEAANEKMMMANQAMAPLLADLKAIKTYLGSDLTATGIKSISDRATTAKNNAIAVNQKYDDAIAELDKASDEIAPLSTTQPTTMSSGM